jgi:hypothetical protein
MIHDKKIPFWDGRGPKVMVTAEYGSAFAPALLRSPSIRTAVFFFSSYAATPRCNLVAHITSLSEAI